MANLDVIRRLSVELEVRGQDTAAAALKRFADAGGDISKAFGPVAEVVDKTTKGFASAGDKAEQLERRYVSVARAVSDAGKALNTLNAPGALDRLGPERFTAVLNEVLGRVPDIKAHAEQMGQEFTRSFNASLRIGMKATDFGASFSALEAELAKQEEIAKAHAAHIATVSQQAIADLTGQNRPSAMSKGATFSGLTDLMRDLEAEEKRQEEQQRLIGQAVADSFWQGFSDRLRIGAKATEGGATFSALDEMMAKEEEIAKARGAHIADLSQRNIATLTGQNQSPATANGATFSALAEQAQQYDRQKRLLAEMLEKADPLGQEMKRLSEAQKAYNTALAEGEITQEQFVKLSEYSSQRIDVLSRNLGKDGLASGLKLSANQFQNLGYQINDVITMASMGASPMQILASQGGQVYQILAGARGGLAGGLAAVKDGFLGLFTPARVVMGGLAAGALTAYEAWSRYNASIREVQQSLIGLGRGTGASTEQLSKIAEDSAGAAGLSNREARSAVATLTSTGRISTQVYGDMLKSAKDYATVTGQALPDATKELSAALADPARGAEVLDQKFNLFNATQLKAIQRMAETGNKLGAQKAIMAAMESVIQGAADKTSLWTRAWDGLGNAISNAFDTLGKIIDGPSLGERIDREIKALQKAQADLDQSKQAASNPALTNPQIYAGGVRAGIVAPPTVLPHVNPELAVQKQAVELQIDLLRKQEEEEDRAAKARVARANDLSREMRSIYQGTDPLNEGIEKLQKNIEALHNAFQSDVFHLLPPGEEDRMNNALHLQERILAQQEKFKAAGSEDAYNTARDAQFHVNTAGLTDFERQLAELDKSFRDRAEAAKTQIGNDEDLAKALNTLNKARADEMEALRRQAQMGIARSVMPEMFQRFDLQEQLKTFSSSRDSLHAMGFDDKQIDAIIARLKTAIETLQTPLEKMLTNYKLEQQSINAVTFEQKATVEAQKAFNDTLDATHDKLQAVTAAEIARNNAIAQSVRQAYDGLRDSRDSAALVGMRPAQREQAQITQEFNRRRLESAPEAKGMLDQAEALQKWQAAEEAMRQPLQEANDNIREQIASARISAETYGHTTAEIAAAAAKQDLLNQYMREGVTITPQLRQKIEEYGQAAGQAASYSEGIHKAQQTMEDIKGAGQDAFKGLISDLRNGTDAGQAFLNMLNKITDKLIDMMLNSMFDTSGSGGGIWQLLSNPSKFFEVLSGKGTPAAPGNVGAFSTMPNATLPNLSTVPMSSTINQAISGSLVPNFTGTGGNSPSVNSVVSSIVPANFNPLTADNATVRAFIQKAAATIGVDPSVATRVADSEGLRGYNPSAARFDGGGDGGSSFGSFQLHYGGINPSMPHAGLGDEFTRVTGLDARDNATWPQQAVFALQTAKQDGWRQWMGAQNSGISRWEGIDTKKIDASVQKASVSVDNLSKDLTTGGQGVSQSLATAAQDVTKGGDGLGNAFQQAAQKLTSGGGGGGGLGGLLGNLFGGSGGFGSGNSAGIDFSFWDNATYATGMHDGGLAGSDVTFRRMVPASLFHNAPRFHTGLKNNEFRAILEDGERVLTKKQNQQATGVIGGLTSWAQANDNAARGGGYGDNKPIVNVNVHNNHPNADVQTKQNPDGSIDVVVDMLQNRLADEAVRGRGPLYKGMTSRADGRALRG